MATVSVPLPDLANDYALTEEQQQSYQENGHICLRNVCSSDEVAAFRPVLGETVTKLNTETRSLQERDTYGKAFLQITNLWTQDEGAKRFVMAQRFAKIAADLTGVEGVRLYHDQALYKEAHGGFTPWHQDQHYWPLDTDNTITMWMPLVDVTPEMGVMEFASGSHTEGYFGDLEISDESEEHFNRFVKERGFERVCHGAMKAGDATFHSGWTLHCAPGNNSERTREVMTVIYFADGTKVKEPDNQNRKNDLAEWLPGCVPGGPAASPLNPVLFSCR